MSEHSPDLLDVLENTDEWWKSTAEAGIKHLADRGAPFEAFDLTEIGVPDPDHSARWGAIFKAAQRAGTITMAGYAISRRPGRHGGITRLWIGTKKSDAGSPTKENTDAANSTTD